MSTPLICSGSSQASVRLVRVRETLRRLSGAAGTASVVKPCTDVDHAPQPISVDARTCRQNTQKLRVDVCVAL